ncbi:AraC family transcriptional regulator [Hahella aquimaris]|uniref:AraC family transcriptional regulator n=1 Tax=Hahella sp. HNIBRBA332 TaxID=3015983 RepID=UPI00273CCB5F|nr:AraC family transcriptional regulator [Hahella sp. HNIBRBA332]WLQ16505.1 AraC family transcriptional regulator [Hahella sp. HNIBRBA332]
MVDRLAALLEHFSINARVFNTGPLYGVTDLFGKDEFGQLHLVRQGAVEVRHGRKVVAEVAEPSLLFYPRPLPHRFITDPVVGADFACANLSFEGGANNPVVAALPEFVCLPLSALPGAAPVLDLLFQEAFAGYCGRQAVLDRLFEVVLIQVLRYLMEEGRTQVGMLAGMAHPRLRMALVAIHEQPGEDWSLEKLADHAGMSRSVFANLFRDRVGCTAGVYLQRWRISLAQRALMQGEPLKLIAGEVGYGSEAALSRAFKACVGYSPGEWRKHQDL